MAAAAMLAPALLAAQTKVTGAGATFPNPIYSKWFDEYHKVHPEVEINYQSIGFGRRHPPGHRRHGRLRRVRRPDDRRADRRLQDEARYGILHFPTVLGAVVPIYNLPGVATGLKFTGETLAGIFLGKITKWNDPAIASTNPGVKLPAADIVVVHRSDGSGTTYIWVDYLSKVSPEWKTKVGKATSVNWPVGLGGKGNEGVAGLV